MLERIQLAALFASLCVGGSTLAGADSLSLSEAIARARVENPELQAAALRHDAARARASQKGYFPNPELSIDVENIGGSGAFEGTDAAETTILVSQALELGGKRSRRARAGELEAEIAGGEVLLLAAGIQAQVAASFAGLLAAQQRVDLAALLEETLVRHRQTLEERVAARKALLVDLERADVSLAAARADLAGERALLAASRFELAMAVGVPLEELPPAAGDLDSISPPSDLEQLLASQRQSLIAQVFDRQIASGEASLSYQRSLRVPDVSVGVGYRRFNETDANSAVFAFTVPLPLFDRNRGEVEAAAYDLAAARATKRAAARDWQAQVLGAHRRTAAAYVEVDRLRHRVLPEAREATEATRAAFEADRVDYLAVVDARRTAYRLERDHIAALEEYHRAQSELERLTAAKDTETEP